ncbi:hypothetical protein BsWGS_18164 [Bradybaena similaris]
MFSISAENCHVHILDVIIKCTDAPAACFPWRAQSATSRNKESAPRSESSQELPACSDEVWHQTKSTMTFQFPPLWCLALVLLVSLTPLQCNDLEPGPNHSKPSIFGNDPTQQNNNDFPFLQDDNFVNKLEDNVTANVPEPFSLDSNVPLNSEQSSKENLINALRKRVSFYQSFFENQEPRFGHTVTEKRDPGFAPSFVGKRAPRFGDTAVGKRLSKNANLWLTLALLAADIDTPRTTTISQQNNNFESPDVETYPIRDSIFQKKRASRFDRRSVGRRSVFNYLRERIMDGISRLIGAVLPLSETRVSNNHGRFQDFASRYAEKFNFSPEDIDEIAKFLFDQVCAEHSVLASLRAMSEKSKHEMCDSFLNQTNTLCKK